MSDEAAVFEAEYVKVAVVREFVRVSFDVPIELKDRVMEVLGGLPSGKGDVRVAIARLTTEWP